MTQPGPEFAPAWNQELRTSAAAVASLIFGILGVAGGFLICGLPPIVAIITGHVGIARTRQGRLKGHGMALAGLIMGYVLILPTILIALFFVVARPSATADIVEALADFFESLLS